MKKVLIYGCFGTMGLGLVLLFSFPIIFKQAFGPIAETVIIKQDIGGELICNSTYSADIQSWYYCVDYKFHKENGEIIEIGKGEYFSREWNRYEQLHKMGEWLVLQTGGEFKTDKLLIGKDTNQNWKSFEISANEITNESLWKSQNIYVNKTGTPSEAYVKDIIGDKIEVIYKFRAGENYEHQETRKITYEFDDENGIPRMSKIELNKEN